MGTDELFKKRKTQGNAPYKRHPKNLPPQKIILIICEGEKTEVNYFKKFKKQFNLTSVTIESSPKSSPTHVVTYAEGVGCKTKKYDEIYCVFDRDQHADFDKALKMAKKLGIKTIVSDPCFEYWILLHFTQKSKEFGASGGSPCKEVQQEKEFEKNLKGYTKDYDFTDLIAKYLKDAIKNANALNKENKSQRPPYTQVVCLVEELMKLAKH